MIARADFRVLSLLEGVGGCADSKCINVDVCGR